MESELEDSLCILYENIIPKPEIEIVNEISGLDSEESELQVEYTFIDIGQNSPERAAGFSENTEGDDSVCILQENNKAEPEALCINKISSKEDKNVSEPSRNKKKTKIECGICLESLNEILDADNTLVSTVCGHIFCNICLQESRKNSTQCPTCRKRLGKNQFHPIYF